MNILIIGATGFIGEHLKEYLSLFSSLNIYTPTSKELNLLNEIDLDFYIKDRNIDIIINCANRGGDRASLDDNIVYINLRMFFNLIKHSQSVDKIITFGSGAEYSKHKPIVKVKEEEAYNFIPLDEYGFYKSVVSKFAEKSKNIYNLRIFGCYGEYENYRFKFISNAIVKNLFNLPITINQNVYFDYIYIYDLVRIIEFFIYNDTEEKIYNASSGKDVDLLTLANIINDTSNFKSEVIVLNKKLNNEYTSNNEKLLNKIGNFEFTPHQEAIVKIREYFNKKLNSIDKNDIIKDPYLKKCKNKKS